MTKLYKNNTDRKSKYANNATYSSVRTSRIEIVAIYHLCLLIIMNQKTILQRIKYFKIFKKIYLSISRIELAFSKAKSSLPLWI